MELGSGYYRTRETAKIVIIESEVQGPIVKDLAEVALVLHSGSVISIQPGTGLLYPHLDLRKGYAIYLSLTQLELKPNRSRPEFLNDFEAFVGARRRVRIRSRQIGAQGTVFAISTDGVSNVSVNVLDGEVDFPYGVGNLDGSGPVQIVRSNQMWNAKLTDDTQTSPTQVIN